MDMQPSIEEIQDAEPQAIHMFYQGRQLMEVSSQLRDLTKQMMEVKLSLASMKFVPEEACAKRHKDMSADIASLKDQQTLWKGALIILAALVPIIGIGLRFIP